MRIGCSLPTSGLHSLIAAPIRVSLVEDQRRTREGLATIISPKLSSAVRDFVACGIARAELRGELRLDSVAGRGTEIELLVQAPA